MRRTGIAARSRSNAFARYGRGHVGSIRPGVTALTVSPMRSSVPDFDTASAASRASVLVRHLKRKPS
jgi:hypothetical protein